MLKYASPNQSHIPSTGHMCFSVRLMCKAQRRACPVLLYSYLTSQKDTCFEKLVFSKLPGSNLIYIKTTS